MLAAARTRVPPAAPPGHLVVEVKGAQLPVAPEGVRDEQVYLRPVEPAFAFGAVVAVLPDRRVKCRGQRGLGVGPGRVVADPTFRRPSEPKFEPQPEA